jgi:hypothetical protein
LDEINLFTRMAEGTPFKSYRKTIPAKVRVVIVNPIDETKTAEVILKGNHKKIEDSCVVDLWSAKQYQMFKLLNAYHIKEGTIVEYERPTQKVEEKQERTIAEFSDEELLTNVLKAHFQTFQKTLNSIEQLPVLIRLYDVGVENNVTMKIMERVKARISEVQGSEYVPDSLN